MLENFDDFEWNVLDSTQVGLTCMVIPLNAVEGVAMSILFSNTMSPYHRRTEKY